MRYIFIIIFLLSCSPMFTTDNKLNQIWINKHHEEIINILGLYNKKVEDLSKKGNNILIWEASKDNIIIPIEKIGGKKNKLGTSISSIHIYIDHNGIITNIKKSVY